MVSVEEARKAILQETVQLEAETIEISESLHRTLAEDIYSEEFIPPFHNCAMDGYAVLHASILGASKMEPTELELIGQLTAGYTTEKIVEEGTAIKVMTGAPLPNGADTVIPIEITVEEGNRVKILKEIEIHENIRFAGEDVKPDQLMLQKGEIITPYTIGMLSALNKKFVKVIKMPTVSLLSTGDELSDIGIPLMPGQIRDINTYSLSAQVIANGGNLNNIGRTKDNRDEIRLSLETARGSDIIIISGGVSVGDCDFVKEVLLEMGMKEVFWRIAVKPGKPVLFGILDKTLIFGLPGNPVSAVVSFQQFVLPALFKMKGNPTSPWKETTAILEEDLRKKRGLFHFIRGKTTTIGDKIRVKPYHLQSSGAFSSMVFSDCLILFPEESTYLKSGEEVKIQMLT